MPVVHISSHEEVSEFFQLILPLIRSSRVWFYKYIYLFIHCNAAAMWMTNSEILLWYLLSWMFGRRRGRAELHLASREPERRRMRSSRSAVQRPVGYCVWRLLGWLGCHRRLQTVGAGIHLFEQLCNLRARGRDDLDGRCGVHRHRIEPGELLATRMGEPQLWSLRRCRSMLFRWVFSILV
jgi:hypothetical protein